MRLIIFDCDGTLVDSQHIIIAAMTAAFEDQNLTPPGDAAVRAIVGLSLAGAIHRLVPEADPALIDILADRYRAAHQDLRTRPEHHEPLYDGAAETVRALARQDDQFLGIATGKARRGLDEVLERHDLTHCFATLMTADDAPSKPHPAMVMQAMDETGANSEQTVMIGDTTYDISMAKQADVHALGVAWGYHPIEDLTSAGADGIVHAFPEIVEYTDRLVLRHERGA